MSGLSVPLRLITHKNRVCKLYKDALRNLQAWVGNNRIHFRYEAILLRERFEKNRRVTDKEEARKLLLCGEEELFRRQHYCPIAFPHSPGGKAYGREVVPPDWVLDYWHPLEKAQYPEYFARREKRKEEFVKMWNRKYMRKCYK
ncbi:NADH dehydrogenase [ubiquinone] 1 beta subcomplex subunit 9-like [Periplaneta americana]|uniref:NADH dehydrogenase [ubiquinone] 1 beta subcomplex subunit 9-like n=1 Tax=Periplaneta americana TaxID=6978 RepID=UPI0037E9150D